MRLNLLIRFLLIVTLCGCLNAVYGQTPPLAAQNQAALEDQLGKLPAELRERGRAVLLEKTKRGGRNCCATWRANRASESPNS